MKPVLSPVNSDGAESKSVALVPLLAFFLAPVTCEGKTPQAEKVLAYLKGSGNGRYMFGQKAASTLHEHGAPYPSARQNVYCGDQVLERAADL